MNKITLATKRFVALMLAVIMLASTISPDVFAATTISLLDGKITIDSDGKNSGLTENDSAGVTATVKADKNSSCGNTTYAAQTNTITITNSSGEKGNLSFNYGLGSNIGGFIIDDVSYSISGSFGKTLEAGETVVIKLTSIDNGDAEAKVDLNNIKIEGENVVYEVTFETPENGSFIIDGQSYKDSYTVSTNYDTGVTATAVADDNYKFVAWLDTTGAIISETAEIVIKPTENTSLKAVFAESSEQKAIFLAASKKYLDLNKAVISAQNADDKKVVLVGDGSISGDYTIPEGVTLLIPFDDAHTCYTNNPKTVGYTGTPILSATPNPYVQPTAYKTLTMTSGSTITVNGAISVSAKHAHAAGSKDYGAAPSGSCGFVKMEADSEIIVNNGGALYAWGFIIGDGKVTIENGGKSYENFQFSDFRGGNVTTNMKDNAQKVFVLSQYYVQNIEVEEAIKHGAEVHLSTSVFMNKMEASTTLEFIGDDGMFYPGENSILTKKYNPKTDRLELILDGTVSLKNISMSLSGVSIDSSKYVLPITNNMTITMKAGSEVVINQDVALLPGVVLNIEEGAEFTISEGKNAYIYDSEQWGLFVHSEGGAQKFRDLVYTPTREYIRTEADLVDAKININGTLNVNGALYTTESGANIISLGETGKIIFNADAPADSVTYQFNQNLGDANNGVGFVSIPVTPAKLHNADNSYSETKKTPAGGIFSWNTEEDRWEREGAHEITWKNEDGTVLSKEFVADGTVPTFDSIPTKTGDAQYSYIFAGWDKEVVEVTEDAVYTATYTKTINKYTVTWTNDDGTVLETDNDVEYGIVPTYDGVTPTKAEDAQYIYTFAGWDKDVVAVTGETTYTAKYSTTVKTYTVTWYDEDGTELEVDEAVAYGETPVYNGAIPTKAGNAQYTYIFAGWTPEVVPVTGTTTYTASYSETVNKYKVTWYDEDGTTVLDEQDVEYGTVPEYAGEEPTKAADVQYTYTFAGWTPEVEAVTGEASYKATYSATVNKYTVTWYDEDGTTVLDEQDVEYGTMPEYAGEEPNKEADVQYTYTFAGWTPEVVAVTGEASYIATYSATVNKYTVTWYDEDGTTVLDEQDVEYGTVPKYAGEEPSKGADAQYTYTFAGWTPEVTAVTGTASYKATYTSTVNKYTVTWYDEDGTTVLDRQDVEYGTVPEYAGEEPDKEATAQYTYTFAGWTPKVAEVTGTASYKATYKATLNKYTVTWYDEDGTTVLDEQDVEYGTVPEYAGEEPGKEADAQYTYTFAGWTPEVVAVTGEASYKATYTSTVNKYTVTWYDEDGTTVLDEQEVEYGTVPEYAGEEPSKAADAQYTYTFADWTPEVEAVTGAASYKATYKATVNKYTVTWYDEDGTTVLDEQEVEYGTVPEYAGKEPSKAADAQYTYTFAGWTPEVVAVTGGATYTATYTSTVNKYTVTWLDEDGTELKKESVEYGKVPVYEGTPEKAADAQYTYTFAGWDKEVEAVTADATYTATYTSTVNEYTVTWLDEDGTELKKESVEYGKVPVYEGTPGKAADAQYTYTFAGWTPEVVAVTGDATYTATYTSTVNEYTVTWLDEDGTELKKESVEYGKVPVYEGTPSKAADAQYTYTFAGWTPEVEAVTGDAAYTATYKATVNKYTVTWLDEDGTELKKESVEYGKVPTYEGTPEKEADAQYTYTFAGWDKEVEAVTGDATYTATYTSTVNKYIVTWLNEDGTELKKESVEYGKVPVYEGTPAKAATAQYTYTFAGWDKEVEAVTGDVTYTATYTSTVNKYTVTWLNYDGTVLETDEDVEYGVTATYDGETPSKPKTTEHHYIFDGWDSEDFEVKGDMVYTAVFEEREVGTYKVFLKDEDGSALVDKDGNKIDYILVKANKDVVVDVTPVKTGYTFKEWKNIPETMPEEDITLNATWTVNQYTITFNTDGGSDVAPITQDYNTAVTEPAIPTKVGHKFVGWEPAVPGTMPAENITIKANWKVNQYTITFDTAGGSDVDSITKDYGTAIDIPSDPVKEGYTFTGWDTVIPETMEAGNITITATWKINQYTLRFDSAGGSPIEEMVVDFNTDLSNLPIPTREGYTFLRWELVPATKAATNGNEVPATMPARDLMLIAIWDANEYTITFVTNGGTEIRAITQDCGTAVTAPEDPTKEGHTFVKWDVAVPATMPAKDMTITAEWKINQYTITFDTADGTEIPAITQDFGTAVTVPEDPTREGYTFDGWDVTIPATMPAKDMTVTANWNVNQYTITFDTVGGSEMDPITLDYGTELPEIKAPVKEGYNFGGWTPALGTTMPAGDVTVTAIWNINQYTIEFVTDGGTEIDSIVADFGTPIVKPADPVKEGYTFTGWDVEIPDTMPATYLKVTAGWKINQYTITFDTVGGSEVAPITQDYGTAVVAPTAPVKTGHTFAGWDMDIPTTMPAKDMTITATWKANQYTITFMTNGGTEVAPITKDYGTALTAPAAPVKTGYTFLGWDVEFPATMPEGGLTLNALWAPIEYDINWDTDGDGKVDETTKAAYDSVPTHEAGKKNETAEYTYEFIGWTPSIEAVTGEAIYTAQFKAIPKEYKVSFDTDGGNKIGDVVYEYGSEVKAPAAPVKEGYTFLGWTPALPATMPAANVTVKAQWKYTYTGWVNDANGTTYHVNGEQPYVSEWVDIEDATYYFDENGYVVKGMYETTSQDGTYKATFIFDKETGAFEKDMTGLYESGNDTYWIENGEVVKAAGLVRVVKADGEVNYYYFGADNKAVKDATIWISDEDANGYLPANNYTLDEEGVILHDEDTSKNGMVVTDGVKYYYIDGVKAYMGLIKVDGYYYYANTTGTVIANRSYWITKTNGLLDETSYNFDAEGRIILDRELKNGIYKEDGSLFYYVDDVRTYAGLIKIDGSYYYVRTSGELAHSCNYWITKTNDLMEQALYTFDENGKMLVEGEEEPEIPEVPVLKNGIYKEDGSLFYYVDDVRTYAGLIMIDGKYYYVRTSGELAHSCDYWITKTNDLMDQGLHTFDQNGVMSDINGIVERDGSLYYYVDGVRTYAGLIKVDGAYYYVRTSGELARDCDYWVTKTNGIMPEGTYHFDKNGKMTNPWTSPEDSDTKDGIVKVDGKLYYYEDGKITYAGLIKLNGSYYYVKTNGEVVANCSYWITKTNNLMKQGSYKFDANGKMIQK